MSVQADDPLIFFEQNFPLSVFSVVIYIYIYIYIYIQALDNSFG